LFVVQRLQSFATKLPEDSATKREQTEIIMRWWLVGAVAAVGLLVPALAKLGVAGAPSSMETKARRDLTVSVAKGDPAMLAAREKGRATLEHFLSVNENRPANSRAYAVKIPVEDQGKVEWFWITNFVRDGDRFWGHIDNERAWSSTCARVNGSTSRALTSAIGCMFATARSKATSPPAP
jgi:Uncharacterized protein conserved in bacteria (DUF2314)